VLFLPWNTIGTSIRAKDWKPGGLGIRLSPIIWAIRRTVLVSAGSVLLTPTKAFATMSLLFARVSSKLVPCSWTWISQSKRRGTHFRDMLWPTTPVPDSPYCRTLLCELVVATGRLASVPVLRSCTTWTGCRAEPHNQDWLISVHGHGVG
jgi:hypothetical protein